MIRDWWHTRSLRQRLVLGSTLVSVTLTLLVAVLVFRTMSNQLYALTDATLNERAFDLQARAIDGDPAVVGGNGFAQMLSADGTVLATSPGLAEGSVLYDVERFGVPEDGSPRTATTRVPFIDSRIRSVARVVDSPNDDFRVVVAAATLDAVDDSRRRLLLWLAIATPIGAAGIAAIGRSLIRASLGPVRAMSRRATALDPGEEGGHIDGPPGHDEFSELAEAFNGLLARIEQARARERSFIADVSHELRTPFSILRGELELARVDNDLDVELDRTLASAIEEIDRMIALTVRLLHNARSSAGQASLLPVPTDLRLLITRLIQSIPRQGSEHITIDTSHVGAGAHVVDPDAINQILTNLVVNALDHAESEIRISTTAGDGGLRICVADDGTGFAPELIGSEFVRFRSESEGPSGPLRPGFGLGLSIAQSMAQSCGGSIEAARDPSLGGALVTVRVPSPVATRI